MNQTGKGIGRNSPCPCGSGRKYKQCCLEKDEAAARESRTKAAEKAAKAAKAAEKKAKKREAESGKPAEPHADGPRESGSTPRQPSRPRSEQPWRRSAANAHPVQRKSLPRKVGGK